MRLKMLFLQILFILPLTTFGERLGYTEELVRDIYAVIKKSGTIGDLINNLPVSDKERKSYWEFIEKYGTENFAIGESTLKSRQIVWKLESGRQIVQDFSRISVGELLVNGKVVPIKGRSLEQIYGEIKNVTSNRVGADNRHKSSGGDLADEIFYREPLVSFFSWIFPTAFAELTPNKLNQFGVFTTGGITDAMNTFAARSRQEQFNVSNGLAKNFCPSPGPCLTDGISWTGAYLPSFFKLGGVGAGLYDGQRTDYESGNFVATLVGRMGGVPIEYHPGENSTGVVFNIRDNSPETKSGQLYAILIENL